jgi:endoglucanase
MQKLLLLIVMSVLILQIQLTPQGFLHRDNKKIVDGDGNEVLLKGMGLGNWLVQEGYMMQTSAFANAQWQIRSKISALIGETNTETFYQTFRNNYIKKADIDSLKKWGFNSVRLPMHYNLFATNTTPPTFLNTGFEIIDSLLNWCEQNQIYLILDMHAAPGGQSDEPISDYNPANPSLWEIESNKDLLVIIWRKIAERYKDESWIGGYDLINEPKWNLPPSNQPLRDLYIRLTDTIRTVDNNHILFIEGNWFATDFTGLTPAWDENMSYSFHKYWNGNTQSSIQYLIDLRNSTNLPLWLGETGENSNQWFVECIELMKTNNIGWAWWPHKKISSIAGPLSAPLLPAYQSLLNYWTNGGTPPSSSTAFSALMAQAEMLKIENCRFQKDVIDAMFRQVNNSEVIPFANNQIPGIVQSVNYDMGRYLSAYSDVDYQNTGNGAYNSGYIYRNDGVDIQACNDPFSNGYNVGWTQTGEWLKYTVNINTSGTYNVLVNVSAPNAGGKIILSLNSSTLGSILDVPATGGWQNWQYITMQNVWLPQGTSSLQVRLFFGNFNLSYIKFDLIAVDVETDIENLPIEFSLKQNYPNPFNPTTHISWKSPNSGWQTLKIYDVLGIEVATLVDEYRNAGYYELEYQASNLPSGIYFYKLNSGNYTDTKKLILLK